MKLITANMNHFVRIQVGVSLKRWTNNARALLLICSFCHQSSGQKLSSIWKANNISYSAKIIWRVFALLLLLSYLLCLLLLTVSEMLDRVSSTSSHRYDRNSHFTWVYLYETELLNSCWCRAEAIGAKFSPSQTALLRYFNIQWRTMSVAGTVEKVSLYHLFWVC